MLSVAIHKDIAEYQPKVIGKLTGRTLISITVALGLSIAVAQKLQPLVVLDRGAALIGIAGVGKRDFQQFRVFEFVTDDSFQLMAHGRFYSLE